MIENPVVASAALYAAKATFVLTLGLLAIAALLVVGVAWRR